MSEKPFPMPGTVWRWTGNDMAPRPSGPHVVESLRWFRERVEVMFVGGESCAGVNHMMTLDAWECVEPAGERPARAEGT